MIEIKIINFGNWAAYTVKILVDVYFWQSKVPWGWSCLYVKYLNSYGGDTNDSKRINLEIYDYYKDNLSISSPITLSVQKIFPRF